MDFLLDGKFIPLDILESLSGASTHKFNLNHRVDSGLIQSDAFVSIM